MYNLNKLKITNPSRWIITTQIESQKHDKQQSQSGGTIIKKINANIIQNTFVNILIL